MENTIKDSLKKSISYREYKELIESLLRSNLSTGQSQSEALTHYSQLNQTRMNRLDKTMLVDPSIQDQLIVLKTNYIWLVISEGWCGDAAQLLPIFNKLAGLTANIDLRIVLRDDNPELMELFLTNGTKSIPKLIVIEKDSLKILAHWGPRPAGATALIKAQKELKGVIDDEAKRALQLWYLNDHGISTQRELADLMREID